MIVEYTISDNVLKINTLHKEHEHNVTIIKTTSTEQKTINESITYIYGLYFDDSSNEYILDFKPLKDNFNLIFKIDEFKI